MKAVIWIVVGIVVLGILYAGFTTFMASDTTTEAPAPKKPEVSKWNGKATKPVGTVLFAGRKNIFISGTQFFNLNKPRADVLVRMAIEKTGQIPSWVKTKGAFTGIYGINRVTPGVLTKNFQSSAVVQVFFKDIPVGSLGQLCGTTLQNNGGPKAPFFLQFNTLKRGEPMSFGIIAPPPPVGHCLGKGAPFEPSVKIITVKAYGNGKRKTVYISGVANTRTKKVRVTSGGRAVAYPAVRGNKRFSVKFRSAGQKKIVVRVGTNKRPNLASKAVVVRTKKK